MTRGFSTTAIVATKFYPVRIYCHLNPVPLESKINVQEMISQTELDLRLLIKGKVVSETKLNVLSLDSKQKQFRPAMLRL